MPGVGLPAGADPAPGEAVKATSGQHLWPLEIRLFGPTEVRLGAAPLPHLRSRKGLWLLALLALRTGRDVQRDWLVGTLWPECLESDGRHSLRQSLYDLRLALGPETWRLTAEGTRTLRLDVSGAFVDALEFDAAVRRGDPGSLEAAVGLYRGPLLEDCAEQWSLEERRPREQAFLAALESLAATATARRDHAAAAGYLRLAVGIDPFQEQLQRALMQALADAGSPNGALLVHREFRSLLWSEMAAEPAAETTDLFSRLREQTRVDPKLEGRRRKEEPEEPKSDGAKPEPGAGHHQDRFRRQVPLPLTELIGREEDVREVIARLASARLVTLTGTGGVGKTRLTIQVAQELAEDYVDGVAFVELAALSDPALVPQAAASALGIKEEAGSPLAETLVVALRTKQLLLVLDNCEHLLDGSAALADAILRQCAGVRILATSRQALGVRGETVWRVPSLLVPAHGWRVGELVSRRADPQHASSPNHQLATLNQYPAVRLFVQRARAAEASFELTGRNAPAVAEDCRRLDGIPLALELAAARVSAMPVEQIAARLDDRFRLLTSGSPTVLARHRTLRAAIDWSYDLLSEAERALMRWLSVFAGGCTLEAAEAVCGDCGLRIADCGLVNTERLRRDHSHCREATPHPPGRNPQSAIRNEEVLDLLTSLVSKSLVVYEELDGQARYRLLETIRQYFCEQRPEHDEEEAIRGRHLAYFTALAEEAEKELLGARQGWWLERLETEHENLRAALSWSPAGEESESSLAPAGAAVGSAGRDGRLSPTPDTMVPIPAREAGIRLAAALMRFWMIRGYLAEGRERLAQALARSPEPTPTRARALTAAGILAYRQADYPAARSLYEEGLAIARASGDRLRIGRLLNNLGILAIDQAEYEAARPLCEEGLAIKRELGDRRGVASSLNNLGIAAFRQETMGRLAGITKRAWPSTTSWRIESASRVP